MEQIEKVFTSYYSIDTSILMFDGTIKMVQDITIGDDLMGNDSTSRKVIALDKGEDDMYDIIPIKGDTYRVSSDHFLYLKASGYPRFCKNTSKNDHDIRWIEDNQFNSKTFTFGNDKNKKNEKLKEAIEFYKQLPEQFLEISVKDYLKLPKSKIRDLKGYRTSVDYPEKDLPMDPYIIGLWLGDGTSSQSEITNQDAPILHYLVNNLSKYKCHLQYQNSKRDNDYKYRINGYNGNVGSNEFLNVLRHFDLINNKHIPMIYKCNSRENRLKVLAGLLDSDGNYDKTKCIFEFSQCLEHERVIDDTIYLCRSLGFACYKNKKKTSWTYNGIKKYGDAWRICISGEGIEEIPTLCERKKATPRKQIKSVLVTGITVKEAGIGKYYGFEVDGNHKYLLGDFTVNSC